MEDIKPWEGGPSVPLMNDRFIGWQHVPIESIRPDPASVHVDNRYNEAAKSFEGLIDSIAQWGMAENIIVSKMHDGDYLIIDGVRRFRAATRLGFPTLMCMVYESLAEGERADLRAQIYFRGMEVQRKARAEFRSKDAGRVKRIAA
jgi:ParB-like chromosome segregation protein Spo0J